MCSCRELKDFGELGFENVHTYILLFSRRSMNFSRYLTLEAELRQNYLMLQIKKTKMQLKT